MTESFDEFCGSTFLNVQEVWNSTVPNLSDCFQMTVLIGIPCAFLWIFVPLEIVLLARFPHRWQPWTVLNISKLVFSCLIILLFILELSQYIYLYLNNDGISYVNIFSLVVLCTTLMVVTCLMYAEKRRGMPPSGIVFIFWLLLSLASAVMYWINMTKVFDENVIQDQMLFIVHMTAYPLITAELILCSFSEDRPSVKVAKGEKKSCPEFKSSFLSRIIFSWFDGLIITGFCRTLLPEDIWELDDCFKSQTVIPQFQKHWEKELKKQRAASNATCCVCSKEPSLSKALCKTFVYEFLYTTFLDLWKTALMFVSPLILELLINFIQSGEPTWHGYLYGAIIFSASLIQSFLHTQHFKRSYSISVKLRAALISAIYKKALRLSNAARRSSTTGEIVNVMSVDIQYLLYLIEYLNAFWSSPLQVGIAFYMLWRQLGPSVLAGVAVLVLMLPVNLFVSYRLEKQQVKQMKNKDLRVKLTNELLNGIKVLKMYAWELPFAAQINKVRKKELSDLKALGVLYGVLEFLWRATPFFILLVTFATYVLSDSKNVLDAPKAFVSLTLFNIIQMPLVLMPDVMVYTAQSRVSLKRMCVFLLNEELESGNVMHESSKDSDTPVIIENGLFSWDDNDEPVLSNINIKVPKGQLIAIVGSVGVGKSSLLSAVLGEVKCLNGVVKIQGDIAYLPQQAWIQNDTVRNNILFGSSYDAQKYKIIIAACDLESDIEMFLAGSDTEIGEKGVNLSGGQKQRISLARAVYNDADVYLLDDPLSAVDSHVGKHIFNKVIGPTGILKGKTRLLVTHSITYLRQVDIIVVLKNNTVSEMGSYQQLIEKKGAFAEFLLAYLTEIQAHEGDKETQEIKEELKKTTGQDVAPLHTRTKIPQDSETRKGTKAQEQQVTTWVQDGKLMTTEEAEIGQVSCRVYLCYLRSLNPWLTLATLLLFALAWACSVSANIWLEAWSSDPVPASGMQDTAVRDRRLGIYALLGFLFVCLILAASIAVILNSNRASAIIHEEMLTAILHSPMDFFDTTPIGRILNRFSQDMNTVDFHIPLRVSFVTSCVMEMFCVLVVIAMATPMFLIALVPIGILYYVIQELYIRTSRQIKRMESINLSPVYTHFSETLAGVSTIRAYRKQTEFAEESNRRVDEAQCYYYANIICYLWLQIRLDFVGNVIVICAIVFAVLNKVHMSPSAVGLSITYALSMTALLIWLVYVYSSLEKDCVAVERIREYTNVHSEGAWEIKDTKPGPNWPEEGCVSFNNFKTRYRDGLPLVLHGITCNISSGEKIGVVGRTGAGKSSLTLALFRIIEAAEGSILIDGIDISKIGLRDLRSKLTIIPQDPMIFSGTLRSNLDPFDSYTDEQIWAALEHSHLHNFVKSLPATLNHEMSEDGGNLSVGQRQLLCLGRALLRNTKVLILDEATAAVDLETDEKIQETIKKAFAGSTIITIAHRLDTIMDYNRVMVLDAGSIKEFDSPFTLLQDTKSMFYMMAKDAGLV